MPHPRKFVQNSLAGETEWGAANGRRNIVRNEYSQSKKLWQATIMAASVLDIQAVRDLFARQLRWVQRVLAGPAHRYLLT